MPYKDKKKQAKAQHESYIRNKHKYTERNLNRKLKVRKWFIEYTTGNKCKECGEDDIRVLDYHHREPDDKYMSICKMVSGKHPMPKIIVELEKCDCLCSNCHRKLHYSSKFVA